MIIAVPTLDKRRYWSVIMGLYDIMSAQYNKSVAEAMKRYRIMPGMAYNGCLPVTIYWVQVLKSSFWGQKWVNVKGYESHDRAKELLDILER